MKHSLLKHSLLKDMLVLFLYLYILVDYATAVNTRASSDQSDTALHDNSSSFPKLISVGIPLAKDRKELPDLNKSPPISDTEEIKKNKPSKGKTSSKP